jgi:type I restriction enzyme S subunit
MAGDSKTSAISHLADAGVHDLPDGWGVVEVGELLAENRGISVGVMYPGDHSPDGIPLIKAGDLQGSKINARPPFRISHAKHQEYRRTELSGGELVMTLVGNVGQCAVVPHEMRGWNVARAVAVIRLSDPSDAHYVQQCLLSRPLQHLMNVWCNTTVQATLNLKEIRQLPLPWPPKSCRDAIAGFGKTLDDKIELNRRLNATLEAMSRAIFKSWFVDFDPVRQKAAGQRPVGMDTETAALFPDSFEDSEIGEVPKGWEVGCLSDVAEHPRRAARPGEIASGTPYIGLEHMPRRCIALSEWDAGDGVGSNKFEFQRGEILFGKLRPYFHKVGVAPVDGVCSTDIVVARAKNPEWFGFVLGHMSSDEFVAYTNAGSTGTKMPRTNWEDMSRYATVLPPEGVAEAFSNIVHATVASMAARIHQSRNLAALRDTLLPKLLSGEIRIPEAEEAIKKAGA